MSKVFLEKRNLVAAILTVCLLTVTTGCASTVSQEEYDQLESELTQVSAELAQTKQELAAAQEEATAAQEDLHTARSVWQSAQPELELLLLMSEYVRDANLLLAHQILILKVLRRLSGPYYYSYSVIPILKRDCPGMERNNSVVSLTLVLTNAFWSSEKRLHRVSKVSSVAIFCIPSIS